MINALRSSQVNIDRRRRWIGNSYGLSLLGRLERLEVKMKPLLLRASTLDEWSWQKEKHGAPEDLRLKKRLKSQG